MATTTTLGVGDSVWVAASEKTKEQVFVQAKVLAVDETMATVRTTDNEQRIVQIDFEKDAPMLLNPNMAADMCGLYFIHEPGILQNLQERSYSDEPYTAMGSVMVAMNPLRPTPDPPGMKGEAKAATMNIPHPYQMAEVAFQQMAFAGSREVHAMNGNKFAVEKTFAGQSIVISGESGAGKTESAKMCLAHLVKRGGTVGGTLDARLLGTNPILEGFGNATTLRNPNSSRFGKLLKLIFVSVDKLGREYKLDGAAVETYLLERSRITFHGWGERNYHVFYMLLHGPPKELTDEFGVSEGPKNFTYMCPTKEGKKETQGWEVTDKMLAMDKKNYAEMEEALNQVGIVGNDKKEVWAILAAILHMGNIVFEDPPDTKDGEARVSASTQSSVDYAAKLFGVNSQAFVKVFTERHVVAPGGTIIAKRNARAATFAKDAVAKATYSKLFDWLIVRIDEALRGPEAPHPRNPQIGVLDIFGFESFALNGFEQLLINYTNEALQATFNRQVFIAEAQLYEKEGLFGSGEYFGRPADNTVTLDLLQGPGPEDPGDPKTNPKGGLLMIIDSEGMNPDAGDNKFNQRLHQTYNKNPAFLKPHPKDIATTFIVKHYAGPVIYTIGSFLEKNNDSLPGEVDALMSASTSAVVAALFPKPPVEEKQTRGPPKKPPAKSIVRKFQNQIKDLVNNLEATRCSFIRCVKPNPAMKRGGPEDKTWYDRSYVYKQLTCLNIPQTAEVLKNGFPTRIHFSTLVDSYAKILPKDALLFFNRQGGTDHISFVKALFHAFEIGGDQFKLGLTRVFFRSGQLATLDKVLRSADDGVSKEIAQRFKSFYIRNIWKRSIAKVRACNKFNKSLFWIRKRAAAILVMQSIIRTIKWKKMLRRWKKGARFAQKHWRGKIGRRKFLAEREKLLAAKHAREEAERQAKLKAIQEAKDAEERKRLEEEMAALKRAQEEEERLEMEKRRHEEEVERNRIAELEAAMQKAEEEAEKKRLAEEESMKKKRRQTMKPVGFGAKGVSFNMEGLQEEDDEGIFASAENAENGDAARDFAPRKTNVKKVAGGKVEIHKRGRKLRQKSIAPSMKREQDRKMRLNQLNNRILGVGEGKKPEEQLAKIEKEQFDTPVFGYMTLRSQKKSLFFGYTWKKRYAMLSKGDRLLRTYTDQNRSKEKQSFHLGATSRIVDGDESVLKRKYTVEIIDHTIGSVYFACETSAEKDRWMKDLREAVKGFVPTAHVLKKLGPSGSEDPIDGLDGEEAAEDEKAIREMYSAQVRNEKIAQLKKLLNQRIISQAEFDQTVEKITAALGADDEDAGKKKEEDYDLDVQVACPKCGYINNTNGKHNKCVKCNADLGIKKVATRSAAVSIRETDNGGALLVNGSSGTGVTYNAKPLTAPLCNSPYQDGVFSCQISGSERGMDFATFEEFVMYVVDCRFKLKDGSIIGWSVARRFKQWRNFASALEGTGDNESPFDDATRAKLPTFPKKGRWDNLRGVKSASVVQERDNQLREWLRKILAFAPEYTGKEKAKIVVEDDDDDAPEVPEKPDALSADKWESVIDPDTGEEFWWNKETGIATWERPRAESDPPPMPPKPPLMPGWAAIQDPGTGDVYYWHADSQTSTWERPSLAAQSKQYDGTQLLYIPAVQKFFDLKKYASEASKKIAEQKLKKGKS